MEEGETFVMSARTPARYQEIVTYLRGVVADADPGDRLPSDTELCERFGVSRMTARQAVQVLAGEQLLHRERGRRALLDGIPLPSKQDGSRQIGLIDDMLGSGKYVTSLCAGNAILAESGILEGKEAASAPPAALIQERHPGITWLDEPLVHATPQILTAGSDSNARQMFNDHIVSLLRDE